MPTPSVDRVSDEDQEPQRDEDVRDSLPAELDVSGFVGPYRFPDNSRRRVAGALYVAIGAVCVALWALRRGSEPVLLNGGIAVVGAGLIVVGLLYISSGWHLGLDEKEALVVASQHVGFAIGHASAQLGWRGLRSRPTWRILFYSAEEPPTQRGFVLIDAVDGHVVEHLVETNPEDWSKL